MYKYVMTLHFQLNGAPHNRPTDAEYTQLHREFEERLVELIMEHKPGILDEPGIIEVNYVDYRIVLPIPVHGFSIDSTAKICALLKMIYK